MNRQVPVILFFFLLSACAAHEYRIDGKEMTLSLKKPHAKNVVLFSSHNGFKPRAAKKKSGRWEVQLPSNQTFRYFYRVDDALFLPDCPIKEKDDFGSENCIYDPRL